jgi:hypothetical protein
MAERPLERFRLSQFDPWPCGAAASANFRRADGAPGQGGVQGGVHAHPRPICAQSWCGGATDGGAQRRLVAAVAVAMAPARGAHGLAHKRMLGLTCEVGKVLGVLADDERLGNEACFRRRPWRARWSDKSGGGVAVITRPGKYSTIT